LVERDTLEPPVTTVSGSAEPVEPTSAAERDDFLSEKADCLQGELWIHAGVVEAEPHERHAELVAILVDLLGNLFW
jgi:hypothetical protein